jgi:hypothetical protein
MSSWPKCTVTFFRCRFSIPLKTHFYTICEWCSRISGICFRGWPMACIDFQMLWQCSKLYLVKFWSKRRNPSVLPVFDKNLYGWRILKAFCFVRKLMSKTGKKNHRFRFLTAAMLLNNFPKFSMFKAFGHPLICLWQHCYTLWMCIKNLCDTFWLWRCGAAKKKKEGERDSRICKLGWCVREAIIIISQA